MGLFDFIKKKIKDSNYNVRNDIYVSNQKVVFVDYERDQYTEEQVKALVLKWTSHYPIGIDEDNNVRYPRYFYYDYNITNPASYHKELVNKGYLCNATFESIIKGYKVDELKKLLISKGQNVKGLKKDGLIDLLTVTLNNNEKEEIQSNGNLYQISEKGLEYLEKYKEFLTVVDFKKYEISYSLYMEHKSKLSDNFTVRDVVWRIFNERILYCYKKNDYGHLRNNYRYMAEFLKEEKSFSQSLYYFIMVLYFDINLIDTQMHILENIFDNRMIIDFIFDKPLAPGIIEEIHRYSEYHDDKIFENIFKYNNLPYKFIEDNDFKKIVFDIYKSSFNEEKYVNKAIRNAKKIVNNRRQ